MGGPFEGGALANKRISQVAKTIEAKCENKTLAEAWTAKTSRATGAAALAPAPAFWASAKGFWVAVSKVEDTRDPTVACKPTRAAPVLHKLSLVAARAPATTAERFTDSPRTMTALVTLVSPNARAVETSDPATPAAVQRKGKGKGRSPFARFAAHVGRDCAAVKKRTTAETTESESCVQNEAQARRLVFFFPGERERESEG